MLVGSSCRNQSAKFCYFSVVKTCNEAWNVTQESEDSEETNFPDLLLYEKEGNCIETDSPHFATPENYLPVLQRLVSHLQLRYFTYNKENKDLYDCQNYQMLLIEQGAMQGKRWWKRMLSQDGIATTRMAFDFYATRDPNLNLYLSLEKLGGEDPKL